MNDYAPIMPPRRSELAAYLRPGQKLVSRNTAAGHAIDRVSRVRTHIVRDHPAGKHHLVGTTLAIKIGDRIYAEHDQHIPIDRLWEDYYEPQEEGIEFIDMLREQQLDIMQSKGGFRFYSGQRSLIMRIHPLLGALIAAETGCGKTLIGITLAYLRRPATCLLLIPQGVIKQWLDEFAKFWPGQEVRQLTRDSIVDGHVAPGIWMSYHEEFLLNEGGLVRHVAAAAFDMVILDEGHLRQNPNTKMGDRLWLLEPRYRYVLTATPIPNRIADIYPICRWIRPDLTFKYNDQREWIELADGGRKELEPAVPLSPSLFAMELKRIVVAVRKVDLRPDLPPLTIDIHRIGMNEDQARVYSFFENQWKPERGAGGTVTRLRITHLRAACATPNAVSVRAGYEGGPVLFGRPSLRDIAVLGRIGQVVISMGEQVVVGCARTEQNDYYARHLVEKGIPFARIDSTKPAWAHAAQASLFKSGHARVMLIGVKCAYGYSFPECNHGILASPEWGLGTILQYLGRYYRLNSQRPVDCQIYICKGTIEEPMVHQLGLKESAANAVLFGGDAINLVDSTRLPSFDEIGIDIDPAIPIGLLQPTITT
jgi:hypothetical protein